MNSTELSYLNKSDYHEQQKNAKFSELTTPIKKK